MRTRLFHYTTMEPDPDNTGNSSNRVWQRYESRREGNADRPLNRTKIQRTRIRRIGVTNVLSYFFNPRGGYQVEISISFSSSFKILYVR